MEISFRQVSPHEFSENMVECLLDEGIDDLSALLENNLFYEFSTAILKSLPSLNLNIEEIKEEHPQLFYAEQKCIEVVFLPQLCSSVFLPLFDIEDKKTLGFAAFTSGDGLLCDSVLNPKAQVVVFCPSNEDLGNLVAEMSEYYDDQDLLMKKLLNTVTHEIYHQVLFLQSSGGLSAVDIDILYDSGDIYRTVSDCQKGIFLNQYCPLYEGTDSDLEEKEKMEEIVEEEGMKLLNKTGLDFALYYQRVLNVGRPSVKNEKRMNTLPLSAPNAFF